MSWFTRRAGAAALLFIGCVLSGFGFSHHLTTEAEAKAKIKEKKTPKDAGESKERMADRAAIAKAAQSFIAAYLKGDARALAAHWTEQGEYISDEGVTLHGRDVIEKEYTALFAKGKAKVKIEVEQDSLRFPSRDTAIAEGHFKVHTGKDHPTAHKYTVLHVREGGQWLMAVVREWPNLGVSMRELEWLVGSWSAKRDDGEVATTYEWWGEKHFLRAHFTTKVKNKTITGFQMIGKDPATGHIRSWAFDPDGSFGSAVWAREGKKWLQDSAAVLPDGSVLSATNIFTRIDDDTFTFQSVQRTLDGDELPDINPIRVQRIKSKE